MYHHCIWYIPSTLFYLIHHTLVLTHMSQVVSLLQAAITYSLCCRVASNAYETAILRDIDIYPGHRFLLGSSS